MWGGDKTSKAITRKIAWFWRWGFAKGYNLVNKREGEWRFWANIIGNCAKWGETKKTEQDQRRIARMTGVVSCAPVRGEAGVVDDGLIRELCPGGIHFFGLGAGDRGAMECEKQTRLRLA